MRKRLLDLALLALLSAGIGTILYWDQSRRLRQQIQRQGDQIEERLEDYVDDRLGDLSATLLDKD
jgi:hypothetical protein